MMKKNEALTCSWKMMFLKQLAAALLLTNPTFGEGVETTTDEVGDVMYQLLTSLTCSAGIGTVSRISAGSTQAKDVLLAMDLTFYLQAFAAGRGAEVADVNIAFGKFCKSNPEKLVSDFR